MGWSGATARELQRPTTCMIANNCDTVSEVKPSTGPAKAAAVSTAGEIFLGIDVAKARHVVARFVPGEGVKPTEGMTTATLLARVEKYELPKEWWRPRVLPKLLPAIPAELARLLRRAADAAAGIRTQLEAIESEIRAAAPPTPNGVGTLTTGVLDREVCDWQRFDTGKQVGSFVGMSPSEESTGSRRQQGSIDKHGSGRLRFWCIETAWRLYKFQPDYRGVVWAREKLRDANTHRAKQIAVALARRFLVDWWRVRTGRITCAELGLVCKTPEAAAA